MTRNPFLMFQTLIHNFCFWGFIRVPKVFLSDEKIVGLSLISLTFSFSASLRWNLMIASSEEDKWWSFPKCALDLEDFPNLTRTWRICIWLGGYLWTTVAPSCGLLWSCQGTEPVKRLWIMSIIAKHWNEKRVRYTFFCVFPHQGLFWGKVHWWPRNPSLWMIKWSQWSPRRTGRGWPGSLRKERPTSGCWRFQQSIMRTEIIHCQAGSHLFMM